MQDLVVEALLAGELQRAAVRRALPTAEPRVHTPHDGKRKTDVLADFHTVVVAALDGSQAVRR